jgi:hypothetical protein
MEEPYRHYSLEELRQLQYQFVCYLKTKDTGREEWYDTNSRLVDAGIEQFMQWLEGDNYS